MSGLTPESTYSYNYTVVIEGGKKYKATLSGKLPKLQFAMNPVRVIDNGLAIVNASTNALDNETRIGFQWRKYDAPESLPSSEAYAIVCDGQTEGLIHNLQTSSYYNVRAFYRDNQDKTYYSDWLTFDPSDISYFEPTVRTYNVTGVTSTDANLQAYVMRGTDEIEEQGFEYWEESSANSNNRRRINSGHTVLTGSGQMMNVGLSELKPETTYKFMAFVTAAAGTSYGDEMSFTTKENTSGVSILPDEETLPTIVGYYDMNGCRHEKAVRGINIVVYSDGSVNKVLIK